MEVVENILFRVLEARRPVRHQRIKSLARKFKWYGVVSSWENTSGFYYVFLPWHVSRQESIKVVPPWTTDFSHILRLALFTCYDGISHSRICMQMITTIHQLSVSHAGVDFGISLPYQSTGWGIEERDQAFGSSSKKWFWSPEIAKESKAFNCAENM